MRLITWAGAICFILNGLPIAIAQPVPQPDRQGNYLSNDAPVKRLNPPARMQAGSLWQVVSPRLNCRAAPGSQQPVLRQYRRGTVLEAEVGRGGSDEVLLNALDRVGNPWMPVRGKHFDDRCYVRANRQYIQPFIKSQ